MGLDKEEKKEEPKKSNFATWTVGGETYKLKLQAAEINELEQVYKKNLLFLLDDDENIPPLSTMLTVIQAAMKRWHHGMTFKKVQDLYDLYFDGGKSQIDLLKEVVVPIFKVSGFFTKEMIEEMEAEESLDS